MSGARMGLEVLLPFQVFVARDDVARIVVETRAGSFGLLPHRLDCIAALTPGILVYESDAEGEVCVAVDAGVLVKVGREVLVSVRRAVVGSDLGKLHELVAREFLEVDERERDLRSTMARLETGFFHRFAALRHD